MFHNYSFEGAMILKKAEDIRLELKHPYVGTEHLFIALLQEASEIKDLFSDYGVTCENFQDQLTSIVGKASTPQELNLYTPMLKRVIELALSEAAENNKGLVLPAHFVLALLEEGEGVAIRILLSMNVDLDEIYAGLKTQTRRKEKRNKNLEIMKIGIPLSTNISRDSQIVGREKEISFMIETLLRRQKNNPLLIGGAGVGKTALVEELARRIKFHQVPTELNGMEIVMLEMGALVAGTKYRGEFEERLNKIIKEVIDEKNIILFIDEIHSMVNAGGAEGAISAADILKPYLARGSIKVIGATTLKEYHEFLEKDKALDRRFEKIMIEEPSKEQMQDILSALIPSYEHHYDIVINDENKRDLLEYSDRYLFHKNNPDKTIDLLDSVCARIKVKVSSNCSMPTNELEKIKKKKEKCLRIGDYEQALKLATEEECVRKQMSEKEKKQSLFMTRDDIMEMIEIKTGMKLKQDYHDVFVSLKNNLENRILGQSLAIEKILEVMDMNRDKATSFLLTGSSGVGKTETVKVISETLGTKLIRVDMSEFHSEESINRLIGAPSGYVGYQDDYVFRVLREHPYATILFDEIEKAHPKVLNLLLQILDEAFITDRNGEKIRFDHTIIFLTSNVMGREKIGFSKKEYLSYEGLLSKELLGRIDEIIPYQPISEEVAREYIKRNLHNQDVDCEDLLNDADIERFGLRNLRNIIHKYNKQLVVNNP